MQPLAPASEYCPVLHWPEHALDVSCGTLPYVPAGQGEHDVAPAVLNRPLGHAAIVVALTQ